MSNAKVNFFYGIFVSTPTLIFAADAEPLLEGPLKVISLILARQNSTSFSEGVCYKIPAEIWDQIKRELFKSALRESERKFVMSARCEDPEGDCSSRGRVCSCGQIHTEAIWSRRWKAPSCELCFLEARDTLTHALDNGERLKRVQNLLRRFGLKLAYQTPVIPTSFEETFVTFSALTVLASKSPTRTIEAYGDYDNDELPCTGNTIVNISSAFICLGLTYFDDYKNRFDKLRRTYYIKARDPDESESSIVNQIIAKMEKVDVNETKARMRRNINKETGINPRWIMHLSSEMEY